MLKIYKKVIRIDTSGPDPRLESLTQIGNSESVPSKLTNLLTLPTMIAGAVVGILAFSALFALLLIPVAIVGIRAWWLLRKLKNTQVDDQSLDAEYTVISDTSKKSNSDSA